MIRGLIMFFCLVPLHFFAQTDDVWLQPNEGQWDANVHHKIPLASGWMYTDKRGFTFQFTDYKVQHHEENTSETKHDHSETQSNVVNFFTVKQQFIGNNTSSTVTNLEKTEFYMNYFQGNDKAKWKSKIHNCKSAVYKDFYDNIDMKISGSNGIEYSFLIKPNANPNLIQFEMVGSERNWIDQSGNLISSTPLGKIHQTAPKAWTVDENGIKKDVEIEFESFGSIIQFKLGSYNKKHQLIIDPTLTFSTFTGSTADNWGFTATPDLNQNLLAGGIVFGTGYPITTGAFQSVFAGGTGNPNEQSYSIDIGITKFNATGTTRLYSTLFGGNDGETPNSIVCNAQNELFVMGVTASSNLPMAGASYDPIFNGGSSTLIDNLSFAAGTDIFIARFNETGTVLLASTYVGGSLNDGVNFDQLNDCPLNYNYGDQFRGEIIVDAANNIYVASTSRSSNFPTTIGTDATLNGLQDAVIFKMPGNLSTLTWSSYFGGTSFDTGNSLQINSLGSVYIAGGTQSTDLSLVNTGHQPNFGGGIADGYVARFNSNNGILQARTYIGTGEYDQAYFVQLDLNNDVYVYGQNEGTMIVSPGKYGNANSGQFIRKFNPNLSTMEFNTTVGVGNGHAMISPTAFLVSDCFDIYVTGWGGTVNSSNSVNSFSNTNGFPTTPDAYQTTTNGSNFWLAVLDNNATTLKYATYMGGAGSSFNHVDGGTSRFDKNGRIYHAVCGACGGNNFGFTTTPGVIGPQNLSTNCNLAAFKFDLNVIEALIGDPDPLICFPDVVNFVNNSQNGNQFLWNFGDNQTSTAENPSHFYPAPGNYTVTLTVSDSNNCFNDDIVVFQIEIEGFNGTINSTTGIVCPSFPIQLNATGGNSYQWFPTQGLNNPTISNPIASVQQTSTYSVAVSNVCGLDTLTITVPVHIVNTTIRQDTSICIATDSIVPLYASGGVNFTWQPTLLVDNPNIQNTQGRPLTTTDFICTIITADGCISEDTATVTVYNQPPIPILPSLVSLCYGVPTTITVSGGQNYLWSPNYALDTIGGPVVVCSALVDTTYIINFSNNCGFTIDSLRVEIIKTNIDASNDSIICYGGIANLLSSGGVSYSWSPSLTVTNPTAQNTTAVPTSPTNYIVTGFDVFGCQDTAAVFIDLFPTPFVTVSPSQYVFVGDVVQIIATGNSAGGLYTWSPSEYLSCVNCTNPLASPDINFNYTIEFVDQNSCIATNTVSINYDAILYIPNAFTPDGFGFNNVFGADGGNIKEFSMQIFNRWGELIWQGENFESTWDGNYKAEPCQDGVYIWKAKYTDMNQKEVQLTGHVTLLR